MVSLETPRDDRGAYPRGQLKPRPCLARFARAHRNFDVFIRSAFRDHLITAADDGAIPGHDRPFAAICS